MALGWVTGWAAPAPAHELVVGSKKFTESVILGEILRLAIEAAGWPARHRAELGGSPVLWSALVTGDIHLYPEYTGTLMEELLARENVMEGPTLERALAARGLAMLAPLGFNNTYAVGVTAVRARELGLGTVSDLLRHPGLRLGFSHEFMDREDGWPGLKARYGLPQERVTGLDHDLAYRALAAGRIDVTDLYTTDAEIDDYDLRPLEDDRGYFRDYRAVVLYRRELAHQAPEVLAILGRLAGTIDEATMIAMNAAVKLEGRSEGAVAQEFMARTLGVGGRHEAPSVAAEVGRRTLEHLYLVALSLSAAIAVGLPLGIAAAYRPRLGYAILAVVGVVQTIPSLALFVFMIPLLGIGAAPAVVALFLYSLLPIVRNTHAGLMGIPAALRESALALGLAGPVRLFRIELPLASRAILAGIKTAAVINVGTATLAALIGAGGYGQPILTGIRLDDTAVILQGAVPAALLALAVQGLFGLLERRLVPRGMRLAGGGL
ncbi:MAG: glycine betaine ABC transporter substrate-binding protein [Gammaproteobacteria bacterium]|nr:glycine betaine ABC transporter substrate-binding protein [Gammaproteobacteria bacterium]